MSCEVKLNTRILQLRGNFSLHHRVQTGCGYKGLFPWG